MSALVKYLGHESSQEVWAIVNDPSLHKDVFITSMVTSGTLQNTVHLLVIDAMLVT